MVTNEQTLIYREKVQTLLRTLRNALYASTNYQSFPTDASIASLLGLSPTAFSALSRGSASMNGITLHRCLQLLSRYLSEKNFIVAVSDFSL